MEPSNKAPTWNLVLFMGPLVFAALARILEILFKTAVRRWQQLSQGKQTNAIVALIKGLTYTVALGLIIPLMVHVAASWGKVPTWVYNDALSTLINVGAGLIAMVYAFELGYRTVSYDIWLHHTASVLILAIALTGVFLKDSEQRALMVSFAICIGLPTVSSAPFQMALFAYHLQQDKYRAKMRLAVFFNVSSFLTNRAVVLLPLAYMVTIWGLLTTTSKALTITTLACLVPEHIVLARTLWGIYRLNRSRLEAAEDQEHAAVQGLTVTCVGQSQSVVQAPCSDSCPGTVNDQCG